MKLLLDTHVLLWWLEDNPALSDIGRALIANRENTVFVSAVSLWEISLKQSLGKLRLTENFDEVLAAQPFENLPLTAAHTREVVNLPWHHRDPFDRVLVAQARVSGLRLLTADERIRAYGESILYAR